MKALTLQLGVLLTMLVTGLPAMAVDMPTEVTLIQNVNIFVNIFDGKYEKLLKGHDAYSSPHFQTAANRVDVAR